MVQRAIEQGHHGPASAPASSDAPQHDEPDLGERQTGAHSQVASVQDEEHDAPSGASKLPEVGSQLDIKDWPHYSLTLDEIVADSYDEPPQMWLRLEGPGPGNKDTAKHYFEVPVNGDKVTVDDKQFPFVLKIRYDDGEFKGQATPRTPKSKGAPGHYGLTIGLGAVSLSWLLALNFIPWVRETIQASGMPPFVKQVVYPVLIPLVHLVLAIPVYIDSYIHKNKKEAKA